MYLMFLKSKYYWYMYLGNIMWNIIKIKMFCLLFLSRKGDFFFEIWIFNEYVYCKEYYYLV